MAKILAKDQIGLVGSNLTDVAKCVSNDGIVITPTKVGYILMTAGAKGLRRKFELKQRSLNKPGVVLCVSLQQLEELAVMDDKIRSLYKSCWEKDILLGCILPWKKPAIKKYVPKDGSVQMMMDARQTSCFVIKYGTPSEAVAGKLWYAQPEHDNMPGKQLAFASSANPSGKGNRGVLNGVGDRILSGADIAVEDDAYVKAQQPEADERSRHEQGVMVSMVGPRGGLKKIPDLIRRGLAVERIMEELSTVYDRWNYRHGTYY